MNDLEARYRRALRWYPKAWRSANENAVIGTLLDLADEAHRSAPARCELADFRTSALAIRLGPLGRIPAHVRDRAAALALGLGAAIGAAGLFAMLFDTTLIPEEARRFITTFGPFASDGTVLYGLWVTAFVVSLFGLHRLTVAILLTTLPTSVVIYLIAPAAHMLWSPTLTTMTLLASLAALTITGHPTRTRRGVRRTTVSAASWAAAIGLTIWFQKATEGAAAGRTDWFIGPLWLWLPFAIPFALVLALVMQRLGQKSWAGATLIVLAPLLLFVIFGWRLGDLSTAGVWLVAMLAVIALVYFLPRMLGVRIRVTKL
jgi:hypothetical protein